MSDLRSIVNESALILSLLFAPYVAYGLSNFTRVAPNQECRFGNRFQLEYEFEKSDSPPYVSNFKYKEMTDYLYENGYGFRSEKQLPPNKTYAEASETQFNNSKANSYKIPGSDLSIAIPEGFRIEGVIGKGSKSVVLKVIEQKTGKSFAMKVPMGRNDSVSLMLNLELEYWTNLHLRKNFDNFEINVIPIHASGPKGSYLITEIFPSENLLGNQIHSLVKSSLSTEQYNQFLEADSASRGKIVREVVLSRMPSAKLYSLRKLFQGSQKFALETMGKNSEGVDFSGANIDLTTNNIAMIDGQAVLFDTGFRTSRSGDDLARAAKYTTGEAFIKSRGKEPLLTFERWLEISHSTWMDEYLKP